MTKKLSNAQAKGYQLWYEFSVMRRVSIDFQYSCTYVISDNFLIPLMKDGYFTFWVFFHFPKLKKSPSSSEDPAQPNINKINK